MFFTSEMTNQTRSLKSFVEANKQALLIERQEQYKQTPLPQNYSTEQFKGDKKQLEEDLKLCEQYPQKVIVEAGYMIQKLNVINVISSAALNSNILVLGQENKIENTTFRQRDLIYLTDTKCNILSRGNIYKIGQNQIEVLLQDIDPDDLQDDIPYNLLLSGSDVTFQYNNTALDQINKENCIGQNGMMFIKKLICNNFTQEEIEQEQNEIPSKLNKQIDNIIKQLQFNEEQKEAIKNISALQRGQFYVVQGCPGSGKTCMLSAAIKTYLQLNPDHRILICGPSNISVDNLLYKLKDQTQQKIRIGQASRIYDQSLTNFCVDQQLNDIYFDEFKSLGSEIKKIQSQMEKTQKKMQKQASFKAQFYDLRTQLKQLNKEYRKQTQSRIEQLLQDSQLVFATLAGCCNRNCIQAAQQQGGFDLVVIDEAGQCLDKDICQAFMLAKGSVVICGDPCQLSACILNENLKKNELFASRVLERLCNYKVNFTLLKKSYRLPQITCQLISDQFYDSQLESQNFDEFEPKLIFIDTAGSEQEEEVGDITGQLMSKSISNQLEVQIIKKVIENSEYEQQDIGIIAPYSAQIQQIQTEIQGLYQNIEIHTVDGFQGREKKCIVLSMVRSNQDGEVGFVSDPNRLNVMLSRAKQQLIIVGNSTTLSSNDQLSPIIDYLFDNAECLDMNDFI